MAGTFTSRQAVRYLLAAVSLLMLLNMVLILVSWRRPALGLQDGRLRPCPASPNAVCSQASDAGHAVEPLAFTGDADAAMSRLRTLLSEWPRTRIVTASENYLHAEVSTRILRFVDDVEFLLDRNERVIHVRSASRVGHSDLGVNRARVEALRKAWAKQRSGPG